jgi:predicted GNAT family N-acyltransferase
MNLHYREPNSSTELDSIFRLRHAVYSEDENLNAMVSTSSTHDINEFDFNALHFAAFDGDHPIACIRITTDSETHFTNWVKTISAQNNIALVKNSTAYPFQYYYPNSNWSSSFIEGLKGRKIGEVGRLAIHKNYRKGGVILNGLIASFVDYCKNDQKITTGFGSCTLQLERYYRKFGFSIAQGSIPFIFEGLPEAVIVRFDN